MRKRISIWCVFCWLFVANCLAASDPATFAPLSLTTITFTPGFGKADVKSDNAADRKTTLSKFDSFLKATAITSPDYIIVNIVEWKSKAVSSSDWFVYNKQLKMFALHSHPESLSSVGRIFGSSSVGVLVINNNVADHVDTKTDEGACEAITYSVTAQHVLPKNVQDLRDLVTAIVEGSIGKLAPTKSPVSCYAFEDLQKGLPPLPVDITIKGNVGQSTATSSSTIHDEGYSFLDASVGMPLISLKNIKYDSVNDTVVPNSTNKINPYAFADFYPLRADLAATGFSLQPKLSVGLPIGNQPFNFPFFGGGLNAALGKYRISPFAGILYQKVVRTRTLPPGSPANSATLQQDSYTKRVAKLSFGLGFSVTDALKLFSNK